MNYYPLPPLRKAPLPKWPTMLTLFCGDFLLFVRGNFGLFTLYWLFLAITIKQIVLSLLPSFALYQYVFYFGSAVFLVGHFLHRLFSRTSRQRYPDPRFPGVTIGFLRRRSTRTNLLIVQPGMALLFVGVCVLHYAYYYPMVLMITAHTTPYPIFLFRLFEQVQHLIAAGFATLGTEHVEALLPDISLHSEFVNLRRSLKDSYFIALLHPLLSVLSLFIFNAYSLSYHTEAEGTAEPAPVGEVELSFPTINSQAPGGPSSPSAQALSDDLTQE